jgi:hypothetical protein
LPESIDRRLVMTTVNKRVMEQTAGRTDAVEVIGGHADDFEPLVEVFRRTLRDAYGGAWPPAEENGKKLRRRSAE